MSHLCSKSCKDPHRGPQDIIAFFCAAILFTWVVMNVVSCDEARAEVVIDMNAIQQIESSGNEEAYNHRSGAVGLYQVTPVVVEDYNNLNDGDYDMEDMKRPQANAKVAYWYMETRIPQLLRHFKIQDTVDNRLIAYNAGIQKAIRGVLPNETVSYLKKYHQIAWRVSK